jgi:predicted secreted hydrolase
MGLPARLARPWLWFCVVAALALLCAGIAPVHAATAEAQGAGAAGACTGSTAPGSTPASSAPAKSQGTGVQIPQDEAAHQDPDEWWYFVGHLSGVDAAGGQHCYGFEQVTFQFLEQAPVPVYFGHFAITDLTRGTFQYDVRQDSYPVPTTSNGFSLHTGEWTMSGGSGKAKLHAALPEYTLDLQLQTTKPAALHGDHGNIPYGPLGTSKYYSWTSLLAGGTIIDHGVPVKVTGLSWSDHQWGAFNFASGAGWDWFSVQLTNGKQYMLYFIRDKSGTIVQTLGTQVDPIGRTTNLDPSKLGDTATGSWTSPTTGITYGSGWQVTVPGGHLTITPDLVNQELDLLSTQGVAYWEGSVTVRGDIGGSSVAGVGYTEINPPEPS